MTFDQLREFANKGAAAQAAVDSLMERMRKCPYCGNPFLPQTHNHKFCSYTCRWNNAAEIQKLKRQKK
jgi:hypothetical protein